MASNTRKLSKSVATCELCSEFFSDPRILPCLHSFCYKCLQKDLKAKECDNPSCPTCGEMFQLPDGTLAALPTDLRKNYEAEVAQYEVKVDSEKGVNCDRCIASADNIAISFCCSCCKFLCIKCREDHLRWKETYEHELVDVGKDKAQHNQSLLGTVPHKTDYCTEHRDESLKFYCETCSKLICRDCIVLSHYEHKRDRIEQVAKKEKQDLNSLLEKAYSAVEELESSLSQGEKVIQKIQLRRSSTEQKIREEFKKLYESIQMREKVLLAKNLEVGLEKETALKLQQEPIASIKEDLKAMAILIREAMDQYTPAEILSVKKVMMSWLEKTLHKFSSLHLHPCKTDIIVAVFGVPFTNEIENFGVVTGGCYARGSIASLHMLQSIEGEEKQFIVTTKDINGTDYGYGGEPALAQLKLLGSNECINGDIQDKGDGTYVISITPQHTGDHMLSIMIGNEHIKSSPFVISVRKPRIYSNLSVLKQFRWNNLYPRYVAVNDSKVFVTHSNQFITVFDKLTASQSASIDLGSGYGINGISIHEDFIFVADTSQSCLHKIMPNGKILSTFGNKLSGPQGICVSEDGRIYVAEQSANRISVFDADGTFICHITGNINNPFGVAIDSSGKIHVTNLNNSNVAVFTPQGEFVRHYGSGQVEYPTGIAIGPDGYIFVAEQNSHYSRLLVFDQSFGLKYEELQGTQCYGVTLDNNGNVYVCDYSNARTLQL